MRTSLKLGLFLFYVADITHFTQRRRQIHSVLLPSTYRRHGC